MLRETEYYETFFSFSHLLFYFYFTLHVPFFLLSDGRLFVLSVIYCMHITLCRLTTRTVLMEWLLSHLSTDNSLHFKTDLNIGTYNSNPGNQRNNKSRHEVSCVVGLHCKEISKCCMYMKLCSL